MESPCLKMTRYIHSKHWKRISRTRVNKEMIRYNDANVADEKKNFSREDRKYYISVPH
jgi:hypothetical protein